MAVRGGWGFHALLALAGLLALILAVGMAMSIGEVQTPLAATLA